ncbi:MAG: 1,4-alpha-glucan branching enzyme GlgB [Candidatus Anoxychlamydiales bacterium]|nr:1,4-alpha-glucan branching enzyme GlgB [Candidatus Anoxychlamydiales bacterium]
MLDISKLMHDLDYIFEKRHPNPHLFLGLNKDVIRIFNPNIEDAHLMILNEKMPLKKIDDRGFFEYKLNENISKFDYKLYLSNGDYIYDPYSFDPIISKAEIEKIKKNTTSNLYDFFGSHEIIHENIKGVKFTTYAPNAIGVCLIGEFNDWHSKTLPMRNVDNSGIWEIFIPNLKINSKYKYEITTKDKKVKIKTDPFANYFELRPHNSSIITKFDFKFNDDDWMQKRKKNTLSKPINIYEVHLQSWMRGDDYFCNYKDIAKKLCNYVKEMGYNYIELMPIMEHPLDDSWGYQITGYFSVTSRYGTIDDFRYFVNYMHNNNIGVILDWAPAHFCKDDFSLAEFDGSLLYETKEIHKQWDSKIFNFEKNEVNNFLISSAFFYLEKFHIDGLRVDAVSSMIYLDNAIEKGNWQIRKKDKNYNFYAIDFLKKLNTKIKEKYPDVLIIAEEASEYPGVTNKNELSFDLKWNMGFINDTLKYFQTKFDKRKDMHNNLTFQLMYAFNEKHILCLSHDEVALNSIYSQMAGTKVEKFQNLKLLYAYIMTFPGKKLFFMGSELLSKDPWDFKKALNLDLLKQNLNKKFHVFVKDLNHLYLNTKELYFYDFSFDGFKWVSFEDSSSCLISYLRYSDEKKVLVIHNFSNENFKNYKLKIKDIKKLNLIFNTSDQKYSEDNNMCEIIEIADDYIILNISKLTSLIFEA